MMSVTQEQLDSFHEYASAKLRNGGVESLAQCVADWSAAIEFEETIAAIKRSEEDFAAGRSYTLEESGAEIRRRLRELKLR